MIVRTIGDGTTVLLSIASLFMSKEIDVGDNSPTYAFGHRTYNTKTQMLPIPLVYNGE